MKRFILLLLLSAAAAVYGSNPGGNLPRPKNVIILIGDGMGFNHVRAANMYLGAENQRFELFPVRLALCHYPAKGGEYREGDPSSNTMSHGYNPALAWTDTSFLKNNFTESAAAATALATGMKTYNNAIGMSVDGDTLENLTEYARSFGKSTGVVTSVPFAHATPAGFTAHSLTRARYAEIAAGMLFRSRCDVIMGCGDPSFDSDGQPRAGRWKNAEYVVDSLTWLQLLEGSGKQTRFLAGSVIREVADPDGDGRADPWTVVRSRQEFTALMQGPTPTRVLGCPLVGSTLQEGRTGVGTETKGSLPFSTPLIPTVPSLREMTSAALNVLDNNPAGFFLMVEGGAIDWASHDNHKGRLLEETIGFFDAIDGVIDWVEKNSSWDETLVVVTADHETGLLWGEKPFSPLEDRGKGNLPLMNFFSGDHTNSLVPFYAKGSGCEYYRVFADEYDRVRGPFIQNSEVAALVRFLWVK